MDVIEIIPDTIELDELQEPDLKLDIDETEPRPSVNFGSGIELLMNDKKKEIKSSSNVEINDITKLEDELNDLAESIDDVKIPERKSENTKNIFGGLFGNDKKDGDNIKQVFQNDDAKKPDLGKSTSNMNENKT